MTRNTRSNLPKILLVLVGFISLAAATGCEELLYPLLYPTSYSPTSYYPTSYYPTTPEEYPAYGYYNPTSVIQGAVEYRLDAMETAANGWDEFIRQ